MSASYQGGGGKSSYEYEYGHALQSGGTGTAGNGSTGNRTSLEGSYEGVVKPLQENQSVGHASTTQHHHTYTPSSTAPTSIQHSDHQHLHHSHNQNHTYNQQQQQQQHQQYSSQQPQYSTNTLYTPTQGNATPQYSNEGPPSHSQSRQQHQDHAISEPGNYNPYNSRNNSMTADTAPQPNQRQAYPHQSPLPMHTESNTYTDSVQQLQAPSNTTQPSHQGNTNASPSGQPYYASAPAQNNHTSTMSNPQQQQQQPPSSMSSTRQRTVSGGFETVKAGPPREGKMDLLPYPHSSSHHHNQHAGNSTSGNHPGQVTASSTQRDTSSSRHRSRHSHSQSTSSQYHHPQPQRPNSSLITSMAQTPASTQQEVPYHEPVAPSSGRSANSKGSSTTSEFTKRKNWSQRIVEEMQDILHVLSPNGTILFVSPSIYELCGLTPEEMVGNSITEFMDQNDVKHFEEEFKHSIMTESSLTTYFRLRKRTSNMKKNSGSTSTLGRLKEEDSDDSGGNNNQQNHLQYQPNATHEQLSNMAAEAVAAINLKSDTLLLEVTGQPYYTTSPDGVNPSSRRSRKHGQNGRRRSGPGGDAKMANDEDDEDDVENNDENEDDELANSGNGESSSSNSNGPVTTKSRKDQSNSKKGGSKTCKCFFAMARPYPSRNNATLDTFLELKVENEKLRNKLADIYREIEGGGDTVAGSDQTTRSTGGSIDYSGMGMTHADNGSGYQIRNGNNNGQQQQQQAYFGADPIAVVDSFGNHERQISGFPSRMAGVFAQQQQQQGANASAGARQGEYMDGEGGELASPRHTLRGGPIDSGDGLISSAGLIPSTSNTYGALGIGISAAARASAQNHHNNSTQDDDQTINPTSTNAGLSASAASGVQSANGNITSNMAGPNANNNNDDKKKKMKKQRTDEGEFVCRDCGTVDSPEWRRGPLGPKTLCNACGLRWAKKNKQQQRNSLGGNENITAAK